MIKTLQLTFKTAGGSRSTVTLDRPKDDLDEATVRQAMESLVAAEAFKTKDGAYASPYAAKYVERTVTDLFQTQE